MSSLDSSGREEEFITDYPVVTLFNNDFILACVDSLKEASRVCFSRHSEELELVSDGKDFVSSVDSTCESQSLDFLVSKESDQNVVLEGLFL